MHDTRWPAPVECHVDRVDDQFNAHVRRHRRADDATAEHIEDDREEQEARRRRHVGDIGDPELVGRSGSELAVHQIGSRARVLVAYRCRERLTAAGALEVALANQTCNAAINYMILRIG